MSRKYTYEFIVDTESKTVSFADFKHSHYFLIKTPQDALSALGVYGSPKKANQEFNEKYGLTPTKFKKIWNAIQRKVWVEPVEKYIMRFGFNSRGKICPHRLGDIWDSLELIKQSEKDCTENIIPFQIKHGKDTKMLREHYGKGVWKKLCANSMTRNKHIASVVGGRNAHDGSTIENVIQMPSWMLKKGRQNPYGWGKMGLHCYQLFGKDNIRDMVRYQNLARDCQQMASQLGYSFDPLKHSYESTLEKHNEYKEKINLKKYSKDPFIWMKDITKVVEHRGYKAELLDNAFDIRNEGERMHHCVGAYSGYCAEGEYMVWHVSKDGEPCSTIGIQKETTYQYFQDPMLERKEVGFKWEIQQHYGICNKHVEDEDEKELAQLVVNLINKEKSKC